MDRTTALPCVIAASLLLTGCARGPRPIVVGSKNFTEQVILGEIVARHLEDRLHTRVDRRLNLGGTLLAHQALLSGGIDVYPEYTGTALMAILKLEPASDPDVVRKRVAAAYARLQLVWLSPLGFDNSFAMVIRGAVARAARLETLSDAAAYKPGWLLGAGYEFMGRPDGYPALLRLYHLPVTGTPRTMDLGLLYQALLQERITMGAANQTDGLLSALDVRVLADDRHAFPPYEAALVARAAALEAHPGLREALEELSGKFTVPIMRKLNYSVDGQHKPVSEVARSFLNEAGLL